MFISLGDFIFCGKYRHFHKLKKLFNLKSFPFTFFLSLQHEPKNASDYQSGQNIIPKVWNQERYNG
jgi:hypothetical protein